MSNFYGTVQGNRSEASRTGSNESGITTSAQSWNGSIVLRLYEWNGELCVEVGCDDQSTSYMPYNTWNGTFEEFRYALGL